jgi:hypothetical protein
MTDSDAYEATCRAWLEHQSELEIVKWLELRALLEERPGWRFETEEDGPRWHFGLEGASRLNVSIGSNRVELYELTGDSTRSMFSVRDFGYWLELHEHEYEGFTNLQRELLGELLPRHIEEWKVEDNSDG